MWFRVKHSAHAISWALEEYAERRPLHDREYALKDDQAYEETCHGETVAANPVEVLLGSRFAHEQHDASAAIQRRSRDEIEGAEKQVQGKNGEKDY